MKERLSAFFRNPRFGKNRRISFILTIVALVEIIAIMVISTSAWVESISSIKIFTDYSSSNPSGTKGTVESLLKQVASLSRSSTGVIDLRNYFRQSGGYHLAGASSVDGKTMFFPEIKGGNTNHYRIGNVNDKNVNYISFTIKTSGSAVDLAFDSSPTISFDGTALNQNDVSSKLVRFSIGDNAGNYRVYSLYKDAFTENVPAAEDGTTQSTTVYPFKNFVKGVNKAVTTTVGGFLSFNMWIQDPTGASSSVYHNKAMTVTGLQLVPVVPITLKATYTDNSGIFREGMTGGTVAISSSSAAGDEVYGATSVFYAAANQKIYMKAKASESNGYSFLGFKTSSPVGSSSTTVTSSNNPYEYTVSSSAMTNGGATVYAMFSNTHTIYMRPNYLHNGAENNCLYAAFVFGVDSTGTTQGNWYKMTKVTSGTYNGSYSCTYRGSATSVIFCYMNPTSQNVDLNTAADPWSYRWLQTYDLTVPSRPGEYLYIVTCRQVLNGVTANGITYANGRNDAMNTSSSNPHDFGTNKLLGYWYHNHVKINVAYSSNSNFSESNSGTYSATDSSKPKICASLTDTSRYYTNAYWYNDQKEVLIDGKTYQDIDDNGDIIPQYKYEKKVTLTAATLSEYNFTGWYDNAAGTGTPVSTNQTVELDPNDLPDNGSYTGSNIENTKTYYARYSNKPAATVNIYITPRQNWSSYWLHVWDGNGNTIADVIPEYDSATGYYKASVSTRSSTGVYAILAKNSNYLDQTGDLTILSSTTLGTTYNKRIARDSSVTDRGNYNCVWFIDNTSGSWLTNDWNKSDGGKTIMRCAYNSSTISSSAYMLRQDNGAWIYERNGTIGTSTYFYFWEVYDNNQSYDANGWRTYFASNKRQYKASGGNGHGNYGSGSTG